MVLCLLVCAICACCSCQTSQITFVPLFMFIAAFFFFTSIKDSNFITFAPFILFFPLNIVKYLNILLKVRLLLHTRIRENSTSRQCSLDRDKLVYQNLCVLHLFSLWAAAENVYLLLLLATGLHLPIPLDSVTAPGLSLQACPSTLYISYSTFKKFQQVVFNTL